VQSLQEALEGLSRSRDEQRAEELGKNDWLPAVILTAESADKLVGSRGLVGMNSKQEMLAPPNGVAKVLPEAKFRSLKFGVFRRLDDSTN
jgi:hypothetical protein